jgi:hypothetical protein
VYAYSGGYYPIYAPHVSLNYWGGGGSWGNYYNPFYGGFYYHAPRVGPDGYVHPGSFNWTHFWTSIILTLLLLAFLGWLFTRTERRSTF